MTDVEITPQADDQLEQLETEDRERILKKLDEARDWTEHRLNPMSGGPTTSSGLATTAPSSHGTARTISSSSRPSATAGTSTTGTCLRRSLQRIVFPGLPWSNVVVRQRRTGTIVVVDEHREERDV